MGGILRATLVGHDERTWGEPAYEARWNRGPIEALPASFRVLVFEPTRERPCWVYATCGMSETSARAAMELHMFSPEEFSGHIEMLTVVAHYHHTGHPLDSVGSTVNFGRAWMPGSNLTHGLISRPYRDGPALEHLIDDDGNALASVYWLVPITKSERDHKASFGLESLEALFDQHALPYDDPMRESVA